MLYHSLPLSLSLFLSPYLSRTTRIYYGLCLFLLAAWEAAAPAANNGFV